MARTTFTISDDQHAAVSNKCRDLGITIGTATEQGLHLWLKTPPAEIAKRFGPLSGLKSVDRKRVERYIELLKVGREDLKRVAAKRINGFLAIGLEEAGSRRER